MDEEVINDLYNRAVSKGYKKDRNAFVDLLHTDSEVFNDMYSYVQSKGYKKSTKDFEYLVGVKKKESTVSPSKGGTSVLPKTKADAIAESKSLGTPTGEYTYSPESFDKEVPLAPQSRANKPIVPQPTVKPKEEFVYYEPDIYSEEVLAPKSRANKPKAEIEGKPTISNDEFNRRISTITPELTSKEEEFTVPQLNYQFKDFGFTFEETGLGDAVSVTAPNGKKTIISLGKTADRDLQKFLKDNANQYDKLSKSITNQENYNKTFTDQKEIESSFVKIQQDQNDFTQSVQELYKIPKDSEEYKVKLAELQKKQTQIEGSKKDLNKSVGKYVAMKSTQGETSEYLYNQLLEGLTGAASGTAGLMIDAFAPSNMTDAEKKAAKKWIQPILRESLDFAKSESVTKEYAANVGFIEGAVGGLVKSLPAMLAAEAMPLVMAAQISDDLDVQMDSDPNFKNISENEKLFLKVPMMVGGAVLETYGFRNAIGTKGLLNDLVANAIGKSTKSTTTKTFKEFIEQDIESRIAKGAIKIGAGGLAEFETGASQELLDITTKDIYNAAKGKDMFQTPDSFGEGAKQVIKAGLQEAIGGFILSTPSAFQKAKANNDYTELTDGQVEVLKNLGNDVNVITAIEADLQNKVNLGDLTPTEAEEQLNDTRETVGVMNSIDTEELSNDQIKEALPIVDEIKKLEQQKEGKIPIQKKIIQAKIDELNAKLLKATGNENILEPTKKENDAIQEPTKEGSGGVGGDEIFYTGRGKKYEDLKNTKGEFIFFSKNPKISEWYGGDESNVSEAKLDTSNFLDLTTQESKSKFVKENFTDKDIEELYSDEIKYEENTDRFGRKTRESLINKYRERAVENRFSGDGKEQQFLLNKIKEQGHSGVKLLDTHFGKSDISYVIIDKSKIQQSLKETPTPKGNTSNVEGGSVGVGGDVEVVNIGGKPFNGTTLSTGKNPFEVNSKNEVEVADKKRAMASINGALPRLYDWKEYPNDGLSSIAVIKKPIVSFDSNGEVVVERKGEIVFDAELKSKEQATPETSTEEEVKTNESLKDIESTTNALRNLDEKIFDDFSDKFMPNYKYVTDISEAYHKAKSDGTNPELVKTVEDLLIPKEVKPIANKTNGSKTEKTKTKTDEAKVLIEEPKSAVVETAAEEVKPIEDNIYLPKEDKTHNISIAKKMLTDLGINAEFSGYSDTNGVSVYFTNENGEKIRISDHSVTNKDRIQNEILLNFDTKTLGVGGKIGLKSNFESNKIKVQSIKQQPQPQKSIIAETKTTANKEGKKIVLDEGDGQIINDLFNDWDGVKNNADYKKWEDKVRATKIGTYGSKNLVETILKFEPRINEVTKKSFITEIENALAVPTEKRTYKQTKVELPKPKSIEAIEIEKQIEAAQKEVTTLNDKIKTKASEMGKTYMEDQSNLFGERKSEENVLFSQRVNPDQINKVLGDLKAKRDAAIKNVRSLKEKLAKVEKEGSIQQDMFGYNPEPKKKPTILDNTKKKYAKLDELSPRTLLLRFFATGGKISSEEGMKRTKLGMKDLWGKVAKKGTTYHNLYQNITDELGMELGDIDQLDFDNMVDEFLRGNKSDIFKEINTHLGEKEKAEEIADPTNFTYEELQAELKNIDPYYHDYLLEQIGEQESLIQDELSETELAELDKNIGKYTVNGTIDWEAISNDKEVQQLESNTNGKQDTKTESTTKGDSTPISQKEKTGQGSQKVTPETIIEDATLPKKFRYNVKSWAAVSRKFGFEPYIKDGKMIFKVATGEIHEMPLKEGENIERWREDYNSYIDGLKVGDTIKYKNYGSEETGVIRKVNKNREGKVSSVSTENHTISPDNIRSEIYSPEGMLGRDVRDVGMSWYSGLDKYKQPKYDNLLKLSESKSNVSDKDVSEPTSKEKAKQRVDKAKEAFIKKGKNLQLGGLETLPEFTELVLAYIELGYVTAKDIISKIGEDLEGFDFDEKIATEKINEILAEQEVKEEAEKEVEEKPKGKISDKFDTLAHKNIESDEIRNTLNNVERETGRVLTKEEKEYKTTARLDAIQHGANVVEAAKEEFGETYVSDLLNYLKENSKTIGVANQSLITISLELDLERQIAENPPNVLTLEKQLKLVRDISTKQQRSAAIATGYGILRQIARVGYDLSEVTDRFFTANELKDKQDITKAIESTIDDINNEAVELEKGNLPYDIDYLIQKGVDKEINGIYELLPPIKKSYAKSALKALENVQKTLRSKTYDATIGIPIAIVDSGIEVIKQSIKLGYTVTQAVDAGISAIKKLLKGEKWAKESEFRKDAIESFTKFMPKTGSIVKEALIKAGYGRKMNIKGTERDILDWKKLAGEEGSIENIKNKVEEVLKSEGKSKYEIDAMAQELMDEYNSIRESIIQKAQNELARRNKTTVSGKQRTAAQKLAELYNFGLFEKDVEGYETAIIKAIGAKVSEEGFRDAKKIAKAMETVYKSSFKGQRLNDVSAKTQLEYLDNKLRILLFRESRKYGTTAYKATQIARNYMDIQQTMILNSLKQALENPWSGFSQDVIDKINIMTKNNDVKGLSELRTKLRRSIFKDMTLKGGIGYGKMENQFTNRQHLDDLINKVSTNELYQFTASIATGKAILNAADAVFKASITEKKFISNLIKLMTDPTNPSRMSKEDAKTYIAENMLGQTYQDAIKTATELSNKINKDSGTELVPENKFAIQRFANDIIKSSLEMGGKVTKEQILAAYNAAYKSAGLSLGHESNNFLSGMIKGYSAKLEDRINKAIKEKEWRLATFLTLESMIFRNFMTPFVGGGTNWLILNFDKTGAGLITGLYKRSKIPLGRIDISTKEGLDEMQKRMVLQASATDSFYRGLTGLVVSLLAYAAIAGFDDEDKYKKWRKENHNLAKYLDLFTPTLVLLNFALNDKKIFQFLSTMLNKHDAFSSTTKALKATNYAFGKKPNTEKAYGALGEALGQKIGTPLPWRLARDGNELYKGVTGKDPYRGDYSPSIGFTSGVLQGGAIEYLGYRPIKKQFKDPDPMLKKEDPKLWEEYYGENSDWYKEQIIIKEERDKAKKEREQNK